MSDRRVMPIRAVEGVNAVEPTGFRKTYFEQLYYWQSMSEQYARQRKAKAAKAVTATFKEEQDRARK